MRWTPSKGPVHFPFRTTPPDGQSRSSPPPLAQPAREDQPGDWQ